MGDFRLNRRTALIAVGAGAGVLAASPAYAAEESGTITPPTPVPDPSTQTLAQRFISQQQFVIAHRGAGDVNPEHTAYAYQQAILKGAQAIEISVRSTVDGELVCMHDNALSRTTTQKSGYVSSTTLADVKRAMIDMRPFLGSGTPLQNIVTLDEALDLIAATPAGGAYGSSGPNTIFFLEAKDSAAQLKILDVMTRRGLVGQTVIKMYRNGAGGFDPNAGFAKYAKDAGFLTWCYFDAGDAATSINAMAQSANVDLIGLPYFETVLDRNYASMSDYKVRQVVAMGKPVIMWEIHRRSAMEHFASLGVRGFMSPDPYWLSGGSMAADLKLTTARRQHGMLPAGQQDVANMPVWENGALIHRQTYDESIMLGPLTPLAQSYPSYVLYFTMKWEDLLPTNNWQYGYIAFGRQTDAPFGLGGKHAVTNNNGCYVLAIRPKADAMDENGKYVNGDMIQLLRIDNGTNNPVPVKTLYPKQGFAPNKDINGKIIVRPDSITIDVAGARSEAIADTAYRGPYMHFGRYHDNSTGGGLALSNVTAYRL